MIDAIKQYLSEPWVATLVGMAGLLLAALGVYLAKQSRQSVEHDTGGAGSSGDHAVNQSASGSGPQVQSGNVQGSVQTTIGLPAGDLADRLITEARKTGELATQLGSVTDERDELIKTVAVMQAAAAAQEGDPEFAKQALAAIEGGDTDLAARYFQMELERRESELEQGSIKASEAARHLGSLFYLTDTQLALDAYEKAARYDPQSVDAWNMIGALQLRLGGLDAASDAFRKVLSLGNIASDKVAAAAAHGNLGLIHRTRGDLDEAEAMLRKSLALFEELGSKEGMAGQYGNLGLIHQTRGDLDEAETMHRKSLAIEEELGRKEGMASEYGNLGLIHQRRGDLDEAEAMFRKSLALNDDLGRKEGMANQYGNLGPIYRRRGDLDEAEAMYRKSLALGEELGHREGMAIQYNNIGVIHQTRGDLEAAGKNWRKALTLFKEVGAQPRIEQTQSLIDRYCSN